MGLVRGNARSGGLWALFALIDQVVGQRKNRPYARGSMILLTVLAAPLRGSAENVQTDPFVFRATAHVVAGT